MEIWDRKRYEQEKHRFIQTRIHLAPLWSQFTLVFAASWAAAWFCSWGLWHFFADSHTWARNLPMRYAIAFLFAYGCFFLAVRVWIDFVRKDPHQQGNTVDIADANLYVDSEGCLIAIAALILGFIVSGLFFAAGGAPMLLEAAFEAAFAGVVVHRLAGEFTLGNWKSRLLRNTWKQALISISVLVAVAAWMQWQAPQASTFAQAVRTITQGSH